MTKPITHLLDNEFNPVCDIKRKNIDGTHETALVTCPMCQFIESRRSLPEKFCVVFSKCLEDILGQEK